MTTTLQRFFILVLFAVLSACGGGGGGNSNDSGSGTPTYTITYDGNGSTGGAVPVDSVNYKEGQTVTVLGNTGNLVRAGYTFSGWNTQTDGLGTSYDASGAATFTMGSANVTLYAKWTANPTYTVTYNGNGNTSGSVPVDSTNYEQSQTVTVLGNTGNLVKTGYTFSGWNTQADGLGASYAASGAATLTMGSANVTLYAKWTANPTYTVTYNGNGNTSGSVPVDSTNYEQSQTVIVLGNTGNLVRTNYTFSGWNTQADGLGTNYAASGAATLTMGSANVTLYAKWTANVTGVAYTFDGFTGSGFSPSPSIGQLDSDEWAITGLSDGNLAYGDTIVTGDFARGTSAGGVTTGGIYAFDVGSGNISLGMQQSSVDLVPGTVTLRVLNNSGAQLTSVAVSYSVWIFNDQTRSSKIALSYSTDNISYTTVPAADITSTAAADTIPNWSSSLVSQNLSLTVANGAYFYMRWEISNNGGAGSYDEIGLDDITITF